MKSVCGAPRCEQKKSENYFHHSLVHDEGDEVYETRRMEANQIYFKLDTKPLAALRIYSRTFPLLVKHSHSPQSPWRCGNESEKALASVFRSFLSILVIATNNHNKALKKLLFAVSFVNSDCNSRWFTYFFASQLKLFYAELLFSQPENIFPEMFSEW